MCSLAETNTARLGITFERVHSLVANYPSRLLPGPLEGNGDEGDRLVIQVCMCTAVDITCMGTCERRVYVFCSNSITDFLSRVQMAPVVNKTLAVLAAAGIGVIAYAIYFDHKRRTDVNFRKRLRMLNL
jgi:MAS20 protein import receptor